MAKLNKQKGLIIGGAIVGLLMSGTAIGAIPSTSDQDDAFFKSEDIESGHPKSRFEIGPDTDAVVQKIDRPLNIREDGVRAPAWYYIKVSF